MRTPAVTKAAHHAAAATVARVTCARFDAIDFRRNNRAPSSTTTTTEMVVGR